MTTGVPSASPPETTAYFRPAGLAGVEALHASFVTHAYRPHSHPTWTVAMMERGAASFELDDTDQRADDGELFVLEPESVHTGVAAVPGGWAYKVLYLDPGLIGAWAEEDAVPQAARWVVFRDASLGAALREAHRALAQEPPGLALDEAVLAAVHALRPHLGPGPRGAADAHRARCRAAGAPLPGGALGRARRRWPSSPPTRASAASSWRERSARKSVCRRTRSSSTCGSPGRARCSPAESRPPRWRPQCGFCDQAHLTRVFRRAVGVHAGAVRKIVQDARGRSPSSRRWR